MNTPVYVTIISSLSSGIIGIIISSWFYNRLEKRRLKTDTVKRLLGYRYHVTGEGFSRALNEAFIINPLYFGLKLPSIFGLTL